MESKPTKIKETKLSSLREAFTDELAHDVLSGEVYHGKYVNHPQKDFILARAERIYIENESIDTPSAIEMALAEYTHTKPKSSSNFFYFIGSVIVAISTLFLGIFYAKYEVLWGIEAIPIYCVFLLGVIFGVIGFISDKDF